MQQRAHGIHARVTNSGRQPSYNEYVTGARTPVFRARGITKIYQMGEVQVRALHSVDLDLFEGELAVILGASGSGKSTLLNILGGLDVPTAGEVVYRNHDLTVDDDAALTSYRREHVGFVFQFYNLIPSLTALENVSLVHFPARLSGGEQQRVAIARAIAKRPEVLLCDEPTGALDYSTGKIVLEVIERVNKELGTTTAVITHNAAIAAMADRVIHMRSGEISEIDVNETKVSPAELTW